MVGSSGVVILFCSPFRVFGLFHDSHYKQRECEFLERWEQTGRHELTPPTLEVDGVGDPSQPESKSTGPS